MYRLPWTMHVNVDGKYLVSQIYRAWIPDFETTPNG